ncbi:uncharacterized protein PgNI_08267 [Pyricularia grisea]|uniref:Uncharacterized protein n=1 Tax=Pyricularia grisea TaxID=148305 RepID=A0A6P8AW49_PYRGI|nr:uncharacterized protein PgNI_08267 [Pyricularia grisea]TLD06417.1 hypothetical protein PgNI_08267 [Pyricularia grisea]
MKFFFMTFTILTTNLVAAGTNPTCEQMMQECTESCGSRGTKENNCSYGSDQQPLINCACVYIHPANETRTEE